jgi:hypothetical protein
MEDMQGKENDELLVEMVVRQRMVGLDDEISCAAMCRRAARAEDDAPIQGLDNFNAARCTEEFIFACRSLHYHYCITSTSIAKVRSGP